MDRTGIEPAAEAYKFLCFATKDGPLFWSAVHGHRRVRLGEVPLTDLDPIPIKMDDLIGLLTAPLNVALIRLPMVVPLELQPLFLR